MANNNSNQVIVIDSSDSEDELGTSEKQVVIARKNLVPRQINPGMSNTSGASNIQAYYDENPWKLTVFLGDISILDTNGGTQLSFYDTQNAINFNRIINNLNINKVKDRRDAPEYIKVVNQSDMLTNIENFDDDVIFVGEYKRSDDCDEGRNESESATTGNQREQNVEDVSLDNRGTEEEIENILEEENTVKDNEQPLFVRRNPKRQVQMGTVPYDFFEKLGWEGDDSIKYRTRKSVLKPSLEESWPTTVDVKKRPKPQETNTPKEEKPKALTKKRHFRNKKRRPKAKPAKEESSNIITVMHKSLHHVLSYARTVSEFNKLTEDKCDLKPIQELVKDTCLLYCLTADVSQDDLTKYLEDVAERDDLDKYLQEFLEA